MNKHKILIIDDNENDFYIFSRFLKTDYNILYDSGTGDNIDNQISTINPDVVLLDYHLGPQEGIDLLKIIKKTVKYIPVILLTNEASPDVIISCMKNGADDYLIKDQIDKNRLLITINNLIEKYEAHKHIKELEKFLPICANCKKNREKDTDPHSQSSWLRIEEYFEKHTESTFSHGICPECEKELYSDMFGEEK